MFDVTEFKLSVPFKYYIIAVFLKTMLNIRICTINISRHRLENVLLQCVFI